MNGNKAQPESPTLDNIEDLLSYALALEQEACDRYAELGELMSAHNNREAAEIFNKMAKLEQIHADEIRELIEQKKITDHTKIKYEWTTPEGPETTDPGDLHYLMTPHQALTLALHNEQRAHEFFDNIAKNSADEETCKLAQHLAEEEVEHVGWVKEWMTKFPETEEGWDDDDDPPNLQD
jgi:rubrerythrin